MAKINEGDILKGTVESIKGFGAFVKIDKKNSIANTGLIHISEIAEGYVKDINKYLSIGDKIRVKVIKIYYNKQKDRKEINLSWKDVPEKKRIIKKYKPKRKKKKIHNAKFLPEDTRKVIGKAKIDNFYLQANYFLDKFDGRFKFDNKEILKNIERKSKNIFNDELYNKVNKRTEKKLKDLKNAGYKCESFLLKNDYRIIPGLGGANILETNINLHHIYGVPYIPGSSLKGLAKAMAVEKIKENTDLSYKEIDKILEAEKLDESQNIKDIKLYRSIFGTQKKTGRVNFMDSYPEGRIKFKLDIMTPHYKDYYKEMNSDNPKNSPEDTGDPNPITFLVLEGTAFRFNLISDEKEILKGAVELLEKGLRYMGVGAKTRIGYGYFS